MSFFQELRRRNVFRVGAAYLVLGWVVVQITDVVAPALGLPEFTLKLVIWLGAIGFPFALLLAWAFELTPEGVKRTREVRPDESITRQTGHRLNYLIIGLMAVAIVVLLGERILSRDRQVVAEDAQARQTAAPDAIDASAELDSIAILPFVNMSEDKENEYFGDGLAEELLNLLAKVDGLRVAARTSTFYFKGKDATIADVAQALDVDTVLEGSVRRSGDTIRVVAQLIRADDSTHIWSERYDRPLTDIFQVQDDIANQIVAALTPHLDAKVQPVVTTASDDISPAQFERFMVARQKYWEGTRESRAEARDEFLLLTKAAPGYAPGWAWLGRSWLSLEARAPDLAPATIARPAAARAVEMALELDPNEPMAYVAQGWLEIEREDNEAALASFDRAISLDPALVDAHIWRQRALIELGRPDEAIATLEYARSIDPLHPGVLWGLAHLRNLQGQLADAYQALDRLYMVNAAGARWLESHLYDDRRETARAIYVSELMYAEDPSLVDQLSSLLQEFGLHEQAVGLESESTAVSLAVLGREQEAREAMRRRLAETEDPAERADAQWRTFVALGEFERARDVLWARWLGRDSNAPGAELGYRERVAVGAMLRATGNLEKASQVAAELVEDVAGMSPVHFGGYLWFNGHVALLNGDTEAALDFFRELVDAGYTGFWEFGTPVMFPWLMEDDPRFEPILETILANRDRQLAELKRLRASGMTVAEVREESLSSLTAGPT
jgi:TolB-like protein/tetratricopeptide (TPR) repeat protein